MKILFAGEGGQGVQLAAEILALASFFENKKVSLIPNFGVEQRGGVSLAFVKIEEGDYPKFNKADLLVLFCDRAFQRVKGYIRNGTSIIVGPQVTTKLPKGKWFSVDDKGLPSKVWNIILVNKVRVLSNIVSRESLLRAVEEKLGDKFRKDPKLKKINLEALE